MIFIFQVCTCCLISSLVRILLLENSKSIIFAPFRSVAPIAVLFNAEVRFRPVSSSDHPCFSTMIFLSSYQETFDFAAGAGFAGFSGDTLLGKSFGLIGMFARRTRCFALFARSVL